MSICSASERDIQTEGHMRPMPPETALHDAFLTGNVAVPAESHARPGPSGLSSSQQARPLPTAQCPLG